MKDIKDLGLSVWQGRMLWSENGYLAWLPWKVRDLICALWNHISCAIQGHDEFDYSQIEGAVRKDKVCVSCCHVLRYGPPEVDD